MRSSGCIASLIMNNSIYVLILLGLGLFIAYRTSQSANNREKTHSGGIANVFNFIAAGFIAMLAPTALCNIFFIRPDFLGEIKVPVNLIFKQFIIDLTVIIPVIIIALVMIATALILLIPYAILEKPHLESLAEAEDKGWTREDAETSGL